MNGLNRLKKQITLESFVDDDGVEIIPERTFEYDTLIISVGSTINDFGVKGAEENTIALDTQDQAERFHKKLHNSIIKAQTQSLDNTVSPDSSSGLIKGVFAPYCLDIAAISRESVLTT